MNQVFKTWQFEGEVVEDSGVYLVQDKHFHNRLVTSKTVLHRNNETKGHKHDGVEEVYLFLSGVGRIKIDAQVCDVSAGTLVLISDGAFHQVLNCGQEDLVFISVFEKYKRQ